VQQQGEKDGIAESSAIATDMTTMQPDRAEEAGPARSCQLRQRLDERLRFGVFCGRDRGGHIGFAPIRRLRRICELPLQIDPLVSVGRRQLPVRGSRRLAGFVGAHAEAYGRWVQAARIAVGASTIALDRRGPLGS
jgi:hypothetical protein